MGQQSRLIIARCDAAAAADVIAARVLAARPDLGKVNVVSLPLFPNPKGFTDFHALIETAIWSTRSLFETTRGANISMSLMHETLMEHTLRWRRTFTVGMITICWESGHVWFMASHDWIPEDKFAAFDEEVDRRLVSANKEAPDGPPKETANIASAVGAVLTHHVHFDLIDEHQTLH